MFYFNRYKLNNWRKSSPSNIVEYLLSPASIGLRVANFIFQKIFRINGNYNFMIHYTSIVNGNIVIGRNVVKSFANSNGCYIQGINGIVIGDDTIFAPGIKIISANHDVKNHFRHDYSKGPVIIGNNCWIGANAIILPGVKLGDNVVVGAGAVVTKSFPSNAILVGVPAKNVK